MLDFQSFDVLVIMQYRVVVHRKMQSDAESKHKNKGKERAHEYEFAIICIGRRRRSTSTPHVGPVGPAAGILQRSSLRQVWLRWDRTRLHARCKNSQNSKGCRKLLLQRVLAGLPAATAMQRVPAAAVRGALRETDGRKSMCSVRRWGLTMRRCAARCRTSEDSIGY